MPPPLPDRYRLEVRVGRDDDIEEWLATDTQLDRPVLVRILGPDGDELPPDEREVVRRSHMMGETHQQIAEAMNVPVGTVKSRSARAHRRLATALAHLAAPTANRDEASDVQEGGARP